MPTWTIAQTPVPMSATIIKLNFILIVGTCLASALKQTKLKSECETFLSSGEKGYYYANACFVWAESATGVAWPIAKDSCTQLSRKGHLAVFPTIDLVDKYINKLIEWGASNDWTYWIGLFQTNKTDEPAGNWHWSLSDGRIVPVHVAQGKMSWHAINPDDYTTPNEDCAVLTFDVRIHDLDCTVPYTALCQYDDPDQERKYRRKFKGHRGHESSALGEEFVSDRLACARLCTGDPICHSFSYSNTNGHCVMNQDDGTNPNYPIVAHGDYAIHVWQIE